MKEIYIEEEDWLPEEDVEWFGGNVDILGRNKREAIMLSLPV
jgi:hypothetical protein